jgi:hypothetical protein
MGEDQSAVDVRVPLELAAEAGAVEDVVPQHKRDLVVTHEVGADPEDCASPSGRGGTA